MVLWGIKLSSLRCRTIEHLKIRHDLFHELSDEHGEGATAPAGRTRQIFVLKQRVKKMFCILRRILFGISHTVGHSQCQHLLAVWLSQHCARIKSTTKQRAALRQITTNKGEKKHKYIYIFQIATEYFKKVRSAWISTVFLGVLE